MGRPERGLVSRAVAPVGHARGVLRPAPRLACESPTSNVVIPRPTFGRGISLWRPVPNQQRCHSEARFWPRNLSSMSATPESKPREIPRCARDDNRGATSAWRRRTRSASGMRARPAEGCTRDYRARSSCGARRRTFRSRISRPTRRGLRRACRSLPAA